MKTYVFLFRALVVFVLNDPLGQLGVNHWQFASQFDAVLSFFVQFLFDLFVLELVKVERVIYYLGLFVKTNVHEVAVHVRSKHTRADQIVQADRLQFLFGDEFIIVVN